jgi:putative toxin-antitoxin system antitoxin component (TIGR02293 family)
MGPTTRGEAPRPWQDDPWLGRVAQWDDAEADAAIREGLPIGLAAHLQELLGLTDKEAAQLIGRSRSTYARYRSAGRDLGMAEAERAVRLAQLIALAAETFGALSEPNYALGGRVPFDMAETDPGARVVRDLLYGIQHGHPV